MRFRVRNYRLEEENAEKALIRQPAAHHPLELPSILSSSEDNRVIIQQHSSKFAPIEVANVEQLEDPLLDPLRATAAHDAHALLPDISSTSFSQSLSDGRTEEQFEAAAAEWDKYKVSIIQRYTSSDTIKVSATLDILSKNMKGRGRSLTTSHLQELEDPGKGWEEEAEILSQHEYVARLRGLNDEIAHAWLNNERVTALRLSVKVAKLLSDTSVPRFYPILFVLVTDVMETMGKLVWKRIKGKAEIDENGNFIKQLPEFFTANDIRQEAKETCQNWFFKIGSIRELLPRIYLEIALLQCMHFLEKDPPKAAFQRLSMMIRGVADPLAAAYARLYLARKGQIIFPEETGFLITGLCDYLHLFRRVLLGEFDISILKYGLDKQSYTNLVEPVFDLYLHYIFKHATMKEQLYLIQTFGEQQTCPRSWGEVSLPVSVVVHFLLRELAAPLIASQSTRLCRLIKDTDDVSKSQYLNYKLFGTRLCEYAPSGEMVLFVLKDIWQVVSRYSNLFEYLIVAEVFIDYVLQYCSEIELKLMLYDIKLHLTMTQVNDEAMRILESIVLKIMNNIKDLEQTLTLPHFVNIVDFFTGDGRSSVSKKILASVCSYKPESGRDNQALQDPVTRHFIYELSKSLHKSLDSFSSQDEQRQVSRLISRFVQLVDFGPDLENHLSFLVDCRGTFANLELLIETIVHVSTRLAMMTLRRLRGTLNQQLKDFVKCCITFNEVTIPSIRSLPKCMHLYLQTAEVAMMNGLVSHAEGIVKSSITCLQEIGNTEDSKKTSMETQLGFIQKLCSFLIVMPGHQEHGTFYLLKSLVQVVNSQSRVRGLAVEALCSVIQACGALAQESLPYHVNSMEVVSNDKLFVGDLSYHEELASIASEIVERIKTIVSTSGYQGNKAAHACETFVNVFEISGDDAGAPLM